MTGRVLDAAVALIATLLLARPAVAQDPPVPASDSVRPEASDPVRPDPSNSVRPELVEGGTRPHARWTLRDAGLFLAGGALGLGIHESGHVLFGLVFDANPGVMGISFGPFPFFAITHDPVSPAREYAISSAGFWTQYAASEYLLTRRPDLRRSHAPVAKGVLAFHVLASTAYGLAALGRFGPVERDTLGMARAARVKEGWIGVLVLGPAALDTWRCFRPGARWAPWVSRALKIGSVLLVVRAGR